MTSNKREKGLHFLKALCNINLMCGTVSINSIQNALRLFICFCELPQCCSAELGQVQAVALLNGTIDLYVMQNQVQPSVVQRV